MLTHADFSSIQKYPDTWIPMDKLSIIQVSMISNHPWYPSIHGIQLSGYQKKWYLLILICNLDHFCLNEHACLFVFYVDLGFRWIYFHFPKNKPKQIYIHICMPRKSYLFSAGGRSITRYVHYVDNMSRVGGP